MARVRTSAGRMTSPIALCPDVSQGGMYNIRVGNALPVRQQGPPALKATLQAGCLLLARVGIKSVVTLMIWLESELVYGVPELRNVGQGE